MSDLPPSNVVNYRLIIQERRFVIFIGRDG